MKIVGRLYNKLTRCIMLVPRRIYLLNKRKKLKNSCPSIIASDCFGTFIYHDMKLRFNSPTINLFISCDDFFTFVSNLKGFLQSDVEEVKKESDYPIGEISYDSKKVQLNFMHYKSFEKAREKWNERKKRVDFNNLYLIQLLTKHEDGYIEKFNTLPFKNKLLITDKNEIGAKNVVEVSDFNDENYKPGDILFYKTHFSIKRRMDKIDYISFLNNKS